MEKNLSYTVRPCFKIWGQGGGEEGSGERRDGLLLPHFKEHILKKQNRVSLCILSGLQFLMQTGLASSSQRFSLSELKVFTTSMSYFGKEKCKTEKSRYFLVHTRVCKLSIKF